MQLISGKNRRSLDWSMHVNALVELVHWGIAKNSICLQRCATEKKWSWSVKIISIFPEELVRMETIGVRMLLEIGLVFALYGLINKYPQDKNL